MSEPEIKTINELKIFVNRKIDHLEDHLKKMESDLKSRLVKIDADIRGNGKVGINVQLDRLENSKKAAEKWFWIVVAATAPVLIAHYFSWLSIAIKTFG